MLSTKAGWMVHGHLNWSSIAVENKRVKGEIVGCSYKSEGCKR